jgi:hypothetical protein
MSGINLAFYEPKIYINITRILFCKNFRNNCSFVHVRINFVYLRTKNSNAAEDWSVEKAPYEIRYKAGEFGKRKFTDSNSKLQNKIHEIIFT